MSWFACRNCERIEALLATEIAAHQKDREAADHAQRYLLDRLTALADVRAAQVTASADLAHERLDTLRARDAAAQDRKDPKDPRPRPLTPRNLPPIMRSMLSMSGNYTPPFAVPDVSTDSPARSNGQLDEDPDTAPASL